MNNQDLQLTSSLVSLIVNWIELQKKNDSLSEALIDQYINQASFFIGVDLSDEVKAQAKKDLTSRYQIHVTPGHSILADYEQPNWYTDRKDSIPQKFWIRYRDYLIDKKQRCP